MTNFKISENTHQILLGSLLGDMTCIKEHVNAKIAESHSIKQKDYLLWKNNYLHVFNTRIFFYNDPYCKFKGHVFKRKPEIRLCSRVSAELNKYYESFYKKNKKSINKNLLREINELGLAVWYCDDGSYDFSHKRITFSTQGFSLRENRLLKEWLEERWSVKSKIKKLTIDKAVLTLDVKNTNKFLLLIQKYLLRMPICMYYKLGHLWEENREKFDRARKRKSITAKNYQSKKEVKEKRCELAKKYYWKNREKILKKIKSKEYKEKKNEYLRKYRQRPEVKRRLRLKRKIYRQNPEYREKRRLYEIKYRKRPYVKEKLKLYAKKYYLKRKIR